MTSVREVTGLHLLSDSGAVHGTEQGQPLAVCAAEGGHAARGVQNGLFGCAKQGAGRPKGHDPEPFSHSTCTRSQCSSFDAYENGGQGLSPVDARVNHIARLPALVACFMTEWHLSPLQQVTNATITAANGAGLHHEAIKLLAVFHSGMRPCCFSTCKSPSMGL